MKFNLVDDPWVPVRGPGGLETVSLRTVLTEPERWTSIEVDEIDEFFGLLRLMTTVLNRAFCGPRNPDAWTEIAYGTGYDVAAINAYLDAWRHRFELFDAERPFLQFPELDEDKATGVDVLLPSRASGNAATLFSHFAERDAMALSPDAAARALIHVTVNGRGSLKGGEYGIHGARVAVLGAGLRDTLIENLPHDTGTEGLPVWEEASPRVLRQGPTKEPLPCRGLHSLATWQWRAVRLFPAEDGTIARCTYGHGPKIAGEEPRDPARWYDMRAEKDLEKDPALHPWKDHRLRAERDIWRDTDAMLAAMTVRDRPSVLSWNADVRESEIWDVVVGGPLPELKGSWVVTGVRAARLPVLPGVLRDDRLLGRVKDAVRYADDAGARLRKANYALAAELVSGADDETPSVKRVGPVADALSPVPRFWAALAGRFPRCLARINEDDAVTTWRAVVDAEARRALEETVSGVALTPRGCRAAATALRRLSAPKAGVPTEPRSIETTVEADV